MRANIFLLRYQRDISVFRGNVYRALVCAYTHAWKKQLFRPENKNKERGGKKNSQHVLSKLKKKKNKTKKKTREWSTLVLLGLPQSTRSQSLQALQNELQLFMIHTPRKIEDDHQTHQLFSPFIQKKKKCLSHIKAAALSRGKIITSRGPRGLQGPGALTVGTKTRL